MKRRHLFTDHRPLRRGAIAPLALLFLLPLVACAAFTIEISRMSATKAELQRAADAASLAACWDLLKAKMDQSDMSEAMAQCRTTAELFMDKNRVGSRSLSIDVNSDNSDSGDVILGSYRSDGIFEPWNGSGSSPPTAVQLRVHRNATRNGGLPMLFGKLMGVQDVQLSATSTASFQSNFRGFVSPPSGQTVGLLPFTIPVTMWEDFMNGNGTDQWSYNPTTGQMQPGQDQVLELNIFPHNSGSSGNSGTINYGSNSNGTNTLRRHIREGLNASDMAYYPNGRIELGPDGTLSLNGDTGISAGMKDALQDILGQPRVLPLYASVSGNGNNAYYQIVGFVGVRIVAVDLTGSKNKNKKILIQPASVVARFGIPSDGTATSTFLFTPVALAK